MSDFQSWLTNTLAKSAAGTLDGTETFRVIQTLASKKVTLAAVAAFALASALGTANTWTAAQRFNGTVKIAGATSGLITVQGAAVAGTWTWTLPTSAGTSGYLLSTDGAGVTSWIAPPSTALNVGTTVVAGGTATRILYDNAGVLGEYTISGSGTAVAMATGAALVTPQLGTPASGVLTNCTGLPNASVIGLGTAALVATTSLAQLASANVFTSAVQTVSALTTTSPGWYVQITGDSVARVRVGLNATDVPSIAFGPGSGNRDAFIEYLAAGSLRFGGPDAAAPVAQIQSQQNVGAGTSNTAGANRTVNGSQGTGTGIGGSLIWKVAPAGSTGTSQNALVTALTIDSTKLATFAGAVGTNGLSIGVGTATTSQYRLYDGSANLKTLGIASSAGFLFSSDVPIGWRNNIDIISGSTDLFLFRDAANTLGQRNGTNAQTVNFYNTFTDASNYERIGIEWGAVGANIASLRVSGAGTGATRALQILAGTVSFGFGGTVTCVVGAAGQFTNTHPTGGMGYGTGAGGAVTQSTNKSTGVTLNKVCGQITMNNASLAGQADVGFTLTNSAIAATDVVHVSIASGASADSYETQVDATAAGSCRISLHNVTLATTLSEAVVLNFAVLKAVTS